MVVNTGVDNAQLLTFDCLQTGRKHPVFPEIVKKNFRYIFKGVFQINYSFFS